MRHYHYIEDVHVNLQECYHTQDIQNKIMNTMYREEPHAILFFPAGVVIMY